MQRRRAAAVLDGAQALDERGEHDAGVRLAAVREDQRNTPRQRMRLRLRFGIQDGRVEDRVRMRVTSTSTGQ